ncbi:hypothetical protein [Deinococcus multiflagellatus]|uniref:Transposase n=1 Tax=Deinococcus multiflagellatus TaxID=1656887 RepID=A0ABW1ZGW4_9DEIO
MPLRYTLLDAPTNTKEAKRYRVSPQDIQVLEGRAARWPGAGTVKDQARAVYQLQLDFLRAGVFGLDYPRWLARHSGLSVYTCYYRMRLGLALAVTSNPDQSVPALLAELRERERTPFQAETWLDEPPRHPGAATGSAAVPE